MTIYNVRNIFLIIVTARDYNQKNGDLCVRTITAIDFEAIFWVHGCVWFMAQF
eukprot:SAG31_NODE_18566_length_631_cov_1.216165_1_plen_52_part_01